jgi:hypothetical protein
VIVKNNIALVNIIIILEWIKINKKVLIIKIKTINNHYIFLKMKNKLLTNNIDLDILIINKIVPINNIINNINHNNISNNIIGNINIIFHINNNKNNCYNNKNY